MKRIRVVIVDDSALMRQLLTQIINGASDMEVVGTASDPILAREVIREQSPDVITLDIEMPKMDGLTFLERLMRLKPTPVIMVSTLTERGSQSTLKALELGAVDFVAKPQADVSRGMEQLAESLLTKIRTAATSHVRARPLPDPPARLSADAVLPLTGKPAFSASKVIFIGSSTGGTEALKELLVPLPETLPPILIAQHMPPLFTKSFAQRLDSLCRLHVKEAEHDEALQPGTVYIAPGHAHLMIRRTGAGLRTELNEGPPVNRHRPSVDVLFRSAANVIGRSALGIILTGMGKDGAQGLLEMRQTGAYTMAQDEASCVVFGMPREAILLGAAAEIIGLKQLPSALLNALK
ncbi:protein-glutamate methylesterase/protein-glutamine glutaminase [Chitinibacteraceae bacterium HSL-7]